ncbi:MAG: HAMP domain-containing histidine kinase, partial [Planctomycetota bacterium]|nr:HAMP domain-containing histidine kinase [Planctomycetota bacterium]
MSLFARITWIGGAMILAAVLLALLAWRPASQRTFVQRTDGLLREAEGHFGAIARSLVDETMDFAATASLAADERRAESLQDLPLEFFIADDGGLMEQPLRAALLDALREPGRAGGEKHEAVRREVLDRSSEAVTVRLERLREARAAAASRHGSQVALRAVAAWSGLLLLLLAVQALLLHRAVVKPVRDATAAVVRFGAGERGTRLDPRGAASELAALSTAFNETAAAVERTEGENAELRAGLEEKVESRTAALVRAARAASVGTMAGGIAHEFNNLLGGVLGCVDAALQDDPGDDVKESLAMIRKTARRGVGITDALLRATRAEPELARCDAAALFTEALAEARPPAGITVEREFAPAPLDADAAMLRQVLSNLIRNALHALGDSGRLTLRIRDDGDTVRLEVEDDGPGLDPS